MLGSINSKSKKVVNILDEYEYVYDLREIQNEFLPELKPYEKKKEVPSRGIRKEPLEGFLFDKREEKEREREGIKS